MVNFYGILYSIALISSLTYIYFFCKKKNLNFEFYFNIAISTILISFISSRLFGYIWFKITMNENINIFSFLNSTGFFYGGFLGGLIFLLIYSFSKNLNFFAISDIFSPPLCLAQAIGRLGCFHAGCCYGKDINIFGIYAKRFPTQISEAIFCFILFLFLSKKLKNKSYDGEIFLNYLLFYSIFRFFIEFLRGDLPVIELIGLKISQIISIFLLTISLYKKAITKETNKK